MTILGKTIEDTLNVQDSDNLLWFGVSSGGTLNIDISQGTNTVISEASDAPTILADKWFKVTAQASFAQVLDTSGAIPTETSATASLELFIDDASVGTSNFNDVYFKEYFESRTYIGMERVWDGSASNEPGRFFNGFIYELTVWNLQKDFTADILSTFSLCDCDVGGVANDACLSTGNCISTCAMDTFQDGASCTACDVSCNGNCVRTGTGVNCNLCDNMICDTCDTFLSPGDCQTCATNAELTTAADDCQCDSTHVLQTPEYECTCATECDACTALDIYHCTVCNAGSLKQDGAIFCLPYCGLGYADDTAQACTGTQSRTTDALSDIPANMSAKPEHPQPAKDRGWFFDGTTNFIKADTLASANVSLNDPLHHTGTVDLTIRPIDNTADSVLYSRNKVTYTNPGDEDYVTFLLRSDGYLEFRLQGVSTSDVTAIANSAPAHQLVQTNSSTWVHVAASWAWDGSKTTVKIYLNGAEIQSVDSDVVANPPVFTNDSTTYLGYIGKQDNSNAAAAVDADFYSGFIYEFGLANYVPDITTLSSTSCTGYAGCSVCPTSGSCLSTCALLEFPETNGTCTACHANCTTGCVTANHCSLCADRECDDCSDFTAGATCRACYTNGISDNAGDCQCDGTDERWYSDITDQCYTCHENCENCFGTIVRESMYNCSTCKVGFFMHNSICVDACPTGYDAGAEVCTDAALKDNMIIYFKDFNRFISTYTADASGVALKALLGSTTGYYPVNMESNDPMTVRWGGLYFYGTSIMQISPYDAESTSSVFNQKHTVAMFLKPDTTSQKQYLLYKGDANGIDSRIAFGIQQDKNMFVEFNMPSVLKDAVTNPATDETHDFGTMTETTWTHVAYTVELTGDTNAANTQTIVYVNGSALGTHDIADKYMKDFGTNFFLIGGKYDANAISSSFKGYLFEFKVWNYNLDAAGITTEYSRLTTSTDTSACLCDQCLDTNVCLASCPINQFATTEGGTCTSCDSGCTYGCMRQGDCKVNNDDLCRNGSFPNFTECNTCIQSAFLDTVTNQCACTANATYDTATDSCVCNTNYKVRNDGTCELCLHYVQLSEIQDPVLFADNFIEMTITFDLPGTQGMKTSSLSNCSFMKQETLAKLGTDPVCSWADDAKSVTIKFGDNPTIVQNDLIKIDENILLIDDDQCSTDQETLEVTVGYPATFPTPNASLETLPLTISKTCDAFIVLNGDQSDGGLKRSLEYKFELVSSAGTITQDWSSGTSFSIVTSQTGAGSATATVSVRTYLLSPVATSTQTFTITDEPAATVTIRDIETPYTVYCNENYKFKTDFNIACTTDANGNAINAATEVQTYSWVQTAGTTLEGIRLDQN